MHAFSEKMTIVRNIYKRWTIILESFILIPPLVFENIPGQKSTGEEKEKKEEKELTSNSIRILNV